MKAHWIDQSTKLFIWLDEGETFKIISSLDTLSDWNTSSTDLYQVVTAHSHLVKYTPDVISEGGSGGYYCAGLVDVPNDFKKRTPLFLRSALRCAIFKVRKFDAPDGNPRVTVLIATYNREQLCVRAVNSVLQQTYQNIRCLVVRDGPGKYESLPEDPRVEFHELPRRGKYPENKEQRWHVAGRDPYNYANALNEGPILCILNDDDLYMPDHIETIVNTWLETRAHVIYTEPCFADGTKPFQFDFDRARLERENFIFFSAVAFCGAALALSYCQHSADQPGDWATFKRMSHAGLTFKKINKVTTSHSVETPFRKRDEYLRRLQEQPGNQ